ncbi:hypothetical protein EOL96_03755, partial [Candidatus Saccharibacteria bacterium]|nr:hypothetical protein [Candidatus Saccharibacteria bacterium]
MTTTHAPEILRGIASPIDYLFTPYIHTANYQNTKLTYYNAGLPGYESSFPRDNAVAALLSGDLHLLLTHLATCVRFQATEINPKNGAYPGKIHHEIHIENERIVPISLQGSTGEYTTEYNSCDSTALFLISVEQLSHIDAAAYEQFVAANRAHIVAAAKHITHMLNQDNLFTDTPPTASPHDPGNYELRVTYWKDSILPHTDGKQRPEYPVSFALAHFMAARALVSAATVLKSHEYAALADTMFTHGIATFVQASGFTVYKDVSETYVQHSS